MAQHGAPEQTGGEETGHVRPDWRRCIRECLTGSEPRHDRSEWLIPGLTAEESERLRSVLPTDPLPAAVLIPIIERESEPAVLLTRRASQLRHHPGQVSFPGGRIEPQDAGPAAAALREAREEIGLDPAFVTIVGYLPDHIVISGFRVTPVVAFVRPGFELLLDEGEVQDTFEVPLAHIFQAANHRPRQVRFGFGQDEAEVVMYDIPFGDRTIWGATAGMLVTLYRRCALGAA